MQPNKLGIKLREIRENNNLGTLKTFAPKLGISNNTLATYELGTVLPDVDFLINFAEETDADFDELLNLRIEVSPATQGDIDKASSYFIANAERHLRLESSLRQQLAAYNSDVLPVTELRTDRRVGQAVFKEAQGVANVDFRILEMAEVAVHKFLADMEVAAPPERVAKLVLFIYMYAAAKSKVSLDELNQFLKLVAVF